MWKYVLFKQQDVDNCSSVYTQTSDVFEAPQLWLEPVQKEYTKLSTAALLIQAVCFCRLELWFNRQEDIEAQGEVIWSQLLLEQEDEEVR